MRITLVLNFIVTPCFRASLYMASTSAENPSSITEKYPVSSDLYKSMEEAALAVSNSALYGYWSKRARARSGPRVLIAISRSVRVRFSSSGSSKKTLHNADHVWLKLFSVDFEL